MDKSQVRSTIKEWVRLDDEICELKIKIKELNTKKKDFSETLLHVMKDQEIDAFELSNEGKLVRHVRKTKSPLSKKHLMVCLSKYYKDEETVKKLSLFILDSREEKTNELIFKK